MVLIQQLDSGAEADLLLLADASLLDKLNPDRVVASKVFAGNRLTLMARKGLDGTAETLLARADLTLAVADPQAAPLGRYTTQALTRYRVKNKLVPLKDASGVLAALESGHADLAVLYQTDSKRVKDASFLLVVPEEFHSPVLYQAVLLKPEKEEARKLFDFLTSDSSATLLEAEGFTKPR